MAQKKKASEVKQLIEEQGGKAVTCQCDVSDFTACEKMIRDVVTEFGHLDILVNNAGITRDGLIMKNEGRGF